MSKGNITSLNLARLGNEAGRNLWYSSTKQLGTWLMDAQWTEITPTRRAHLLVVCQGVYCFLNLVVGRKILLKILQVIFYAGLYCTFCIFALYGK
jgi:hypothetical protein